MWERRMKKIKENPTTSLRLSSERSINHLAGELHANGRVENKEAAAIHVASRELIGFSHTK